MRKEAKGEEEGGVGACEKEGLTVRVAEDKEKGRFEDEDGE